MFPIFVKMKNEIYRILSRKHGLKLTSSAAAYLEELYSDVDDVKALHESLDYLAKQYVQQEGHLN
jgi:hypothetical protein